MRILQLSSAQQFGGGERHVVELCRELCARGHQVVLVVRPRSPLPQRLSGLANLTFHELPLRGAVDLRSAYRLARWINAQQIELLHCHYARDYPLAALAVWLARRRQPSLPAFILTRHHYLPMRNNWAYRKLLNNLDYAIAVSNSVATTVNRSFPWPRLELSPPNTNEQIAVNSLNPNQSPGLLTATPTQSVANFFSQPDGISSTNSSNPSLISNSKSELSDAGLIKPCLVVIPNWIEGTEFLLSDAHRLQSREKFGIVAGQRVIGVVNQISAAKGQELVVRAVAQLTQQFPKLTVVLAGREHEPGEPYSQQLRELAKQLGVDLLFTGHVQELAALYQALDIVVIPSENEAFSIVCLEAMAARRLVIASAVGGLAELIQPEQNGLLFPVGDHQALAQTLQRALTDTTATARMIEQAATQLSQRFARAGVIDQIEALYKKAIGERKK